MSNELAIINTNEIMTLGKVFAQSGYFSDARQESQAIVKIMAGKELGFAPITAMTNIYIVNGRVALSANLMASAIKANPKYDYKILQLTDSICQIEFLQEGKSLGTSEFTAQDAKRAGTKNMDKFPRNMLYARAISNGCRWYCPDVFNGNSVYTREELGDSEITVTDIIIPENVETVQENTPEVIQNTSKYTLAQMVHITAQGAGITEDGIRNWMEYKFGTESAGQLTDDQCQTTIDFIKKWNQVAIDKVNFAGRKRTECTGNPNTCQHSTADNEDPVCEFGGMCDCQPTTEGEVIETPLLTTE